MVTFRVVPPGLWLGMAIGAAALALSATAWRRSRTAGRTANDSAT